MKDTAGGLLRSSAAATLSQVWRFGVAFATRMVLRRLVAPAAWGLWHWSVDSLYLLAAQVRDLGLPAQVVRARPRPYGNFLAVEVAWGGFLGLLLALAAPLLARGYSETGPEVVPALRLLVLFFLFEGLARVPLTFFEAELAIERALAPEVLRNLCWAGLSILLAFQGYGVWSLLIAHVAATGLFAGLLWLRAWRRMPLTWITGGTMALVRASLPLMLIALLLLLLWSLPFLILGARFAGGVLGRYGAALELALLTARVLELPIRRPLYPALVAYRDEPGRFFETYRLATVFLLSVQVPAALFLFFNAEASLVLLWGSDYAAAAPYLRILAFALVVQPFGRCAEDVLLARGEERLLIAAAGLNIAALAGLGIYLTAVLGPVGMAWAHLVPLGELLLLGAIRRISPPAFRRLLADLALLYLAPVLPFLAAFLLAPAAPRLRFALSILAALVSFAAYAWRFRDAFRAFFRRRSTAPQAPFSSGPPRGASGGAGSGGDAP